MLGGAYGELGSNSVLFNFSGSRAQLPVRKSLGGSLSHLPHLEYLTLLESRFLHLFTLTRAREFFAG